MTWWVVLLLAAILVVAAGAVALAVSSRREYRAANQILPGSPTGAPPEWAGAHTPEARLHRRLRDAIAALHKHPRRDDPSFLDLRVGLEQQALAVDERLIAVAALPEGARAEPLAAIDAAVTAVEGAVAALATTEAGTPALDQSMADLTERFRYIEQARAELDRRYPTLPADPLAPKDPLPKRADPEAAG